MSYVATVLRVMIASPSDVPDARDAVERAVHGWNDAFAHSKSLILQPWRWETSAVPVLGNHPQALINSQGVDDSDIVFALFSSKLGSPTLEAVSGTVAEIERAVEQGTPVHVYFSTAPHPNDVDLAQLEGLRTFRTEIEARGLLGEFANPNQLGHEVWKAIEHDLANLDIGAVGVSGPPSRPLVDFQVQPRQERELTGMDNRGKPQYTTRRWLEITNGGSHDALDASFEAGGQGIHLVTPREPTVVHAGQTRRLNYSLSMGAREPVLIISWTESGERRVKEFHVG